MVSGSTAISRSPGAFATKICARTVSPSSRRSTSRRPSCEREDIISLAEGLVAALFAEIDVAVALPFRRLTYADAMERYGFDRPDLRYGLELFDASDAFRGSEFGIARRRDRRGRAACAASGSRRPRRGRGSRSMSWRRSPSGGRRRADSPPAREWRARGAGGQVSGAAAQDQLEIAEGDARAVRGGAGPRHQPGARPRPAGSSSAARARPRRRPRVPVGGRLPAVRAGRRRPARWRRPPPVHRAASRTTCRSSSLTLRGFGPSPMTWSSTARSSAAGASAPAILRVQESVFRSARDRATATHAPASGFCSKACVPARRRTAASHLASIGSRCSCRRDVACAMSIAFPKTTAGARAVRGRAGAGARPQISLTYICGPTANCRPVVGRDVTNTGRHAPRLHRGRRPADARGCERRQPGRAGAVFRRAGRPARRSLSVSGPADAVDRAVAVAQRMIELARQREPLDARRRAAPARCEHGHPNGAGKRERRRARIALPGVRKVIQPKTPGQADTCQDHGQRHRRRHRTRRHGQDLPRRGGRRRRAGPQTGEADRPRAPGGRGGRMPWLPAGRHAGQGGSVSASALRRARRHDAAQNALQGARDAHDRDRAARVHARADAGRRVRHSRRSAERHDPADEDVSHAAWL